MQEITVKVTKFEDRKFWLMYFDNPVTGKREWKSSKQTAERDAERAAAKWESELREGRYKPKSNVTWQDFREEFGKHLETVKDGTAGAYLTAINALEAHCKINRLSELTSAKIAHVAEQWRSDPKRPKRPETVASYLRHIQAMLNWAVGAELLRECPKIVMPKRQKGAKLMKGRPITGEEFDRMLAKIEAGILATSKRKPHKAAGAWKMSDEARKRTDKRLADEAQAAASAWRRLMVGLWLSGLRLGEALELSWDDESKILIDLAGKRPLMRILASQQKADRDTILPLTPDFAQFLLQTPAAERSGPVFPLPGKRGAVLSEITHVSRVLSAIGEAAGVVVDKASGKFGSAHDLRRAFGARWATKVMPAVLKELMRHADIGTTMKYYVGQNAESTADDLWRNHGGAINTFVNSPAASGQTAPATESQLVDG